MCIVCHYKGDNRLVTTETRMAVHPDGRYRCVRPYGAAGTLPNTALGQWSCIDCKSVVDSDRHVCEDMGPPTRSASRKSLKESEANRRKRDDALKARVWDKT